MKLFAKLNEHGDWGLLALRIAVSAIFLYSGFQKLQLWVVDPSEQLSGGMLWLLRFLSIVEPLGGLAILIGFLTPIAAAGLGIIMIGAIYFKIFIMGVSFATATGVGWEFDLIILAATITLFFFGAGKFGLDRIFFQEDETMV